MKKRNMLKLFLLSLVVVFLASNLGYSASLQEEVNLPYVPISKLKSTAPYLITKSSERNSEKDMKYKDGEILVKFKHGISENSKNNLHKKQKAEKTKEFSLLRIHHVRIKKGMSVEEAIGLYKSDPAVEYAEPNFTVKAFNNPGDLLFNELWGLYNIGQTGGTSGADIKALDAWDIATGNTTVVVAVIDTGIDYAHADVSGNLWTNQGEIPGDSIDNDGNGYADDIYGIDTFNHDSDPIDDNGHGTHVSGTIGAVGNNAIGVVGINWNVKIMTCKFLDSYGSGYTDGAIECLEYIKALRDSGVTVIASNNSWGGGGYSQALYDAINQQQDTLFIAAAGNGSVDNDKNESYPANYELPNVISVAATDHNDFKAYFSQYGRRSVHVGAPGVDIVSLRANGTDIYGDGQHFIPAGDPNAAYYRASGTSMATPHVAGLAALIKSEDMNRDWRAIKNLILSGGDTIASMDETTITGKRINAYGSLSCTSSTAFSILKYPATVTVGMPVTLSALSITCEASAGPVTATTALGEIINLSDDGVSPDLAAGDGIFTGAWTPSREAERLTFSSPAGTETIVTPALVIASYLPEGNLQIPSYNHTLTARGGLPPYSWAIISGTLPPGLSFNGSTGNISGNITTTGQTLLTVQVTDSFNATATKNLLLRLVDEPVAEEWARAYPHTGDDLGWGMAVDGNGNVYVTGESHPGSFYSGDSDYLTVKYDSAGNMLWSRTFDRGGRDIPWNAAVDSAGNAHVLGWSYNTETGGDDGFIVKYDPSGNILWTRATHYNYGFFDIAVDGNSNVYASGWGGTVKYDSAGNELWARAFPNPLNYGSESRIMTLDNNGNAYVIGTAWTYNPSYLAQTLIVKYDPSGNELWVRTFDSQLDLRDAAIDNVNGYLYVVNNNTPGILKYDLDGNFQWFRDDLRAYGVAVDVSGNVYLSSYTGGYDFSALTFKYDPGFNLLWSKTYETFKSDVAFKIGLDSQGNVYSAGWSEDEDLDFLVLKYREVNPLWDTIPYPFTFTDLTNQLLSTEFISDTITVTGINAPSPISVSFCSSVLCEYSINGGAFTSAAGTVNNGDTVTVRQISSGSYSTTTAAVLTIGGISDAFSVTTAGNNPPALTNFAGSFSWMPEPVYESVDVLLEQGDTITLSASGAISGTLTLNVSKWITIQSGTYAGWGYRIATYDLAGYTGTFYTVHDGAQAWGMLTGDIHAMMKYDGIQRTIYLTSIHGQQTSGTISLGTPGRVPGSSTTLNSVPLVILDGGLWSGVGTGYYEGAITQTVTTLQLQSLGEGISFSTYESSAGNGNAYSYFDFTGPMKGMLDGALPGTIDAVVQPTGENSGTIEHVVAPAVWTWGANWAGSLGDGTNISRETPDAVAGLSGVTHIVAPMNATIALKSDGTLWAWGENYSGELGDGTNENKNTPVQLTGISDVESIAAGWFHALALKSDGTLWRWGNYSQSFLGSFPDLASLDSNAPVQVTEIADIRSIGGGGWHSIAMKNDGTAWTWGINNAGQLGNGTLTNSAAPVQVIGLNDIIAASGGFEHTLALKSDGTVWAWGDNRYGELGNGTNTNSSVPVRVSGLSDVIAVFAGASHSVALKSDGTVWTWGLNDAGQLGDGTNTNRNIPTPVSGLSNATAISAKCFRSIALTSDGTVWAWGRAYSSYSNIPLQVRGLHNVFAIAAGMDHTAALSTSTSEPFTLITSSLLPGTFGNNYYQTLTAAHGTLPYTWSIPSGSLPYGLSLEPSTGLISGIPTATGTFCFTAQVTDAEMRTDTGTICISIYEPLIITTPSLPSGTIGVPYSQTLTAAGGIGSYTWSDSGNLPDGLSLNIATGVISGIPTTEGVFPIWVYVYDANSGTGKELSITIDNLNTTDYNGVFTVFPPTTVEAADVTVNEGDVITYSATGVVSGTLTLNVTKQVSIQTGSYAGWGYAIGTYELAGYTGVGYTVFNAGNHAWGMMTGDIHAVIDSSNPQSMTLNILSINGQWRSGTVNLVFQGVVPGTSMTYSEQLGILNGWAASGTVSGDYIGLFQQSGTSIEMISLGGGISFGTYQSDAGNGNFHSYFSYDDLSASYKTKGMLDGGIAGIMESEFFTPRGVIEVGTVISGSIESLPVIPSDSATVWTWGANFMGQLGDGTTISRLTPLPLVGLDGVTAISTFMDGSIVLKSDGTVWDWGDGNVIGPRQVDGLDNIIKIAGGWFHALALKNNGTVWTWTPGGTATQVPDLNDVIAIAAGDGHSLAVKADHTVRAWGSNVYGELGDGTNTDRIIPVEIIGLDNVVAVAAGFDHSMALKSDGTVWTWGSNSLWGGNITGQLGNGTDIPYSNFRVQVVNLNSVIAIAGGGAHSIAVRNDGSVWSWGANTGWSGGVDGQLGDGTDKLYSNIPVQAVGLSDARAVSGKCFRTVALKNDGTVRTWGITPRDPNAYTQSSVPVLVQGISGVTAIAAGMDHTVALKASAGSSSLVVTPISITDTLMEGTNSNHTLTLTNSGGNTLTYNVSVTEAAQGMSIQGISVNRSGKPPVITGIPTDVQYVEGELIVKLDKKVAKAKVSDLKKKVKAKLKKNIQKLDMEVWELPAKDKKSLLAAITTLSSDPDVIYAEPNYQYKAIGIPNDLRFSELWGMHNTGQNSGTVDADIDAPEAWDRFTGSQETVVAVIDTGVDYTHEDLAANMWVNTDEIAANGIDDDGNGYIDDVYGYDFAYNDSNPMDGHFHGTHCSGTIGGAGDNAIGVAGVNHSVRIMAVKFLDDGGSGYTDAAVSAVIYAVDNGAKILSNSWGGGGYSQALYDAIAYANNHDVLFVAAAGNDYMDTDISPNYPSCYDVPNVMSIAATDRYDQKAGFSNWGLTTVDLGAPGVDVLSSVLGNSYASYSGTSMATPHVAGVAALLKGYNPSLSALDIRDIIMQSVDPISALSGITVTGGRLNANAALELAGPDWIRLTGSLSGSLPPGVSTQLTVSLDSTGKTAGTYEAAINIASNDPVNPLIPVPVTMNVLPDGVSPAPVNDLGVTSFNSNSASLQWTAVGDDNYTGRASEYDIRYSTTPLDESSWVSAIQATGEPTPSEPGVVETFNLTGLQPVTHYWIGIKVKDNSGQESALSNIVEVTTLAAPVLRVNPTLMPPVSLPQDTTTTQALTLYNDGGDILTFEIDIQNMLGPATTQFHASTVNTPNTGMDSRNAPAGYVPTNSETRINAAAEVLILKDVNPWDSTANEQILTSMGIPYSIARSSDLGSINLRDYDLIIVASDQPQSFYNAFAAYLSDFEAFVRAGGVLQFNGADQGWSGGFWSELPGGVTHEMYYDGTNYVEDPDHPIVAGVPGTITGTSASHDHFLTIPGDASLVTRDAANGQTTIEYRLGSGRIIASGITLEAAYAWGWDAGQILINAISYALEVSEGSWLAPNITSGAIPPGGSQEIILTYNSVDLEVGNYTADIVITSNDFANPQVSVPASLEVTPDVTAPAAVSDLAVSGTAFESARLAWTATADDGANGLPAASYDIRYSTEIITVASWDSASEVDGEPTPADPGSAESFLVTGLNPLTTYYFALKVIDDSGLASELSNLTSGTTPAAPSLVVTPISITETLMEPTISNYTLTLTNSGGDTLTYNVSVTEAAQGMSVQGISVNRSGKPPVITGIPTDVQYVEGELIVKLDKKVAKAKVSDLKKKVKAKLKKNIQKLDMEVWEVPAKDKKSLLAAITTLSSDPDVIYAEPNYQYKAIGIPNDLRFSELWGMHNTGQNSGTVDADIDAPEAWDRFTGSQETVVAVIDTGVDYTHEDLAANMWVNTDEIAANGIDDDGNGYIDDVYGYDFAYNDSNPMDGHFHGTHCSGTIGGAGDNAIGVAGVNHSVRIMAVKFLDDGGSGYTDAAVSAVIYAVDNGAKILSNSWGGGGYSQALYDAIAYANNHDVLFVAAAGNDYMDTDISPNYPSCYDVPNVMSIAATDRYDQKAGFSNWGLTTVDLGAPGVDVLSSVLGNSYASYSGTSMATPHVAGVAALLKGYNPSLSALDIRDIIMQSVDPISALSGITVTGGRLNANAALELAGPDWIRLTGNLSGSLPPGVSTQLTVSLDSTGKTAGTYEAAINIASNDPVNPLIPVPVTMHVVSSTYYTVTPVAGPNGSITPSSPHPVNPGLTVTFTVVPDYGYIITSISGCGGTDPGPQPPDSAYLYTTGPIAGDCTVTASFAINPYNIQREALIDLYNSTNGQNWTNKTNWLGAPGSECTWYGVGCDGNGQVVSLYLQYNNLSGTIPSSITNLSNLQLLYLHGNQLTGNILPELGNITNLRSLSLAENPLTGGIPHELANLTNLVELWLSSSQLTGIIPSELGNLINLQSLYLHGNQFTGSIPPGLGNLINLQELQLGSNQLTGSIPPELGNLINLRSLHLESNQLTGTIPPELGDLINLHSLSLIWNQLTGTIPPELGNLINLYDLNISYNQLTGTIPPELGNLTNLMYLSLYYNQLSGSIPPELGNLTNAYSIGLSNNQLTGSTQPELGNLTNLRYLSLSNNQLTGNIPPDLGNLMNLQSLNLSSNQLTGSIPPELANLTNLYEGYGLNIQYNALFTSDPTLRTFLNAKGGDWESTQTVAPTGLSTGSATRNSITVSWMPITYTSDSGGYRILYSTTAGGPYTYFGTTASKLDTSMTVTGLDALTTYSFVVQTKTDQHVYNQNTVISERSAEVSAATLPDPLDIIDPPVIYWEAGKAACETLQVTGGIPPYTWFVVSGSLPSGLTVNSSGQICGTPTTAGASEVTIGVMDIVGTTDTAPSSIVVYWPLTITTSSLPEGIINVPYSQTVTASGGIPPYSWSIIGGSLPTGLTLNSETGEISGTPEEVGSFDFTVQIADDLSNLAAGAISNTASVELSISVTYPPLDILPTPPPPDGIVGITYACHTLQATGGLPPYTNWSVISDTLPPGLTLNSATGEICGIPTEADTFTFTAQVTDSQPLT